MSRGGRLRCFMIVDFVALLITVGLFWLFYFKFEAKDDL
jgi:hypothetical protein